MILCIAGIILMLQLLDKLLLFLFVEIGLIGLVQIIWISKCLSQTDCCHAGVRPPRHERETEKKRKRFKKRSKFSLSLPK